MMWRYREREKERQYETEWWCFLEGLFSLKVTELIGLAGVPCWMCHAGCKPVELAWARATCSQGKEVVAGTAKGTDHHRLLSEWRQSVLLETMEAVLLCVCVSLFLSLFSTSLSLSLAFTFAHSPAFVD